MRLERKSVCSLEPQRRRAPVFRRASRCRTWSHHFGNQSRSKSSRTCFEGPFGEVIRGSGPLAKLNPFRFSSKYQDDETDFSYYAYRYYSASTGRWLGRDPLQEAGGGNLYGFVGNEPITSIDPVGLFDMYVHRDGWGHTGVRDNGSVNYDYGRYRGTYSGGGGLHHGPNILVRSRGWPPQDKPHPFTLYHFFVCPELDAAMNDSLKDEVAKGTGTWPPAVLARFTTPPSPLSADALYMGTDWSLTDNCATFTQRRLNDTIWRVLHNPKSSELAKRQARELQEDSIPGAKAPGPIEDELDVMARQHPDLVKKIPLPRRNQANVQKPDNRSNSNSGSCGCGS